MTIVDRYLFKLFVKTFLTCFLSFVGLFVVAHLFSNLDELAALAKKDGWPTLIWEFYGPRVAEMFDKTAAIIMLAAAIFSVSLLQRRREMTAIEAAGVTKARILRPIFLTAIVIVVLAVANRELLLPKVKDKLVRTAQTWSDQGQVDLSVQEDLELGVVVRGDQLVLEEKKITDIDVQLPFELANTQTNGIPRINAKWATLEDEDQYHPAGLRLHQVTVPKEIASVESRAVESGQTILFTSHDHPWLAPSQCFVACNFDVDQMAYGTKLVNYLSTEELITEVRKPKRWFGSDQQVSVHSRFVRPFLDLALLMLGLPMVMGAAERNVFVSFGICFWIVASFQVTVIVCQVLGASSVVRPAALGAWLPAIVFVPLAVVAMRRLKR